MQIYANDTKSSGLDLYEYAPVSKFRMMYLFYNQAIISCFIDRHGDSNCKV